MSTFAGHPKKKRIIIVGNVDSGKSTLLGVLSNGGELDDGRGSARSKVCKHKHELVSGRTSSLFVASNEYATFMDAPGHEKYNKTTAKGINCHLPDCVICLVAANLGLTRMTREHLSMAILLDLPVLVIVTKIDFAPEHILKKTLARIEKLLTRTRRSRFNIEGLVDLTEQNMNLVSSRKAIPVLQISSVTGKNIDTLEQFIKIFPQWRDFSIEQNFSFSIDSKFLVPGVGIVVGGVASGGSLSVGDNCWLGPDANSDYSKVKVRSIYVADEPSPIAEAGHCATIAIRALTGKKLTKESIRDGMILTVGASPPPATRFFVAEVKIMHHATTIKVGYAPIMHCRNIRQVFKIKHINNKNTQYLRTADTGIIRCELKKPEYLELGDVFLFREGTARGFGKVIKIE